MVEKETRKNNKGLDLERLYQETLPSFVLDYFHIFYELQEHSVEFPSPIYPKELLYEQCHN